MQVSSSWLVTDGVVSKVRKTEGRVRARAADRAASKQRRRDYWRMWKQQKREQQRRAA